MPSFKECPEYADLSPFEKSFILQAFLDKHQDESGAFRMALAVLETSRIMLSDVDTENFSLDMVYKANNQLQGYEVSFTDVLEELRLCVRSEYSTDRPLSNILEDL